MFLHIILIIALLSRVTQIDALFGGDLQPGEKCSVCPPGYGVTRHCDTNAGYDTTCEECVEGTFNERYTSSTACEPCTKCAAMYYAWRACSRIKDAACLPCWALDVPDLIPAGPAYGNEDYRMQCEGKTTTTMATTTTTNILPADVPEEKTPTIKPSTEKRTTTTPTTTSATTTTSTTTSFATTTTIMKIFTLSNKIQVPLVTQEAYNTTADALESEENVTTSSTGWVIIVAMCGGVILFFFIGGTIAVCIRTKHLNKQKKAETYAGNIPRIEEGSSDDDIKEPPSYNSDDDMASIHEGDVTQPLFSAPLMKTGLLSSGTPLLAHSTPDLARMARSRTITPHSQGSGQSGPQESPANDSHMSDSQPIQPSPIAVRHATPLTGAPAMISMDSPANMPRHRLPMFPMNKRSRLSPSPVPSSETPQNQSIDSTLHDTPVSSQINTPSISEKIQMPRNGIVARHELPQSDTSDAASPASSEPSTPAYSKKSPTDSQASTPTQTPVPRHHKWPSSKKRSWPSKRMRGSFNRNLPYIDEDSGDEIVRQTGRPPQENFKDPKDKRVWGLTRQLADMFDRIRGRQPRRSRSHNTSRDLNDSRIDDTMNDISFDFHNESVISSDYHDTTATEFYNPHLRYEFTDTQL